MHGFLLYSCASQDVHTLQSQALGTQIQFPFSSIQTETLSPTSYPYSSHFSTLSLSPGHYCLQWDSHDAPRRHQSALQPIPHPQHKTGSEHGWGPRDGCPKLPRALPALWGTSETSRQRTWTGSHPVSHALSSAKVSEGEPLCSTLSALWLSPLHPAHPSATSEPPSPAASPAPRAVCSRSAVLHALLRHHLEMSGLILSLLPWISMAVLLTSCSTHPGALFSLCPPCLQTWSY